MEVTRRVKQTGADFMKTPMIDIAELIKLHDDFVFNKFKEGIVEDSANFLKEAMAVALEQIQKNQTQEVAPEV